MNNNIMTALLLQKGYKLITNPRWDELAAELDAAQQKAKIWNEQVSLLKEMLLKLTDGNSVGNTYYVTMIERPGSVNYKMIPELVGVDLNKYRGEKVSYPQIKKLHEVSL